MLPWCKLAKLTPSLPTRCHWGVNELWLWDVFLFFFTSMKKQQQQQKSNTELVPVVRLMYLASARGRREWEQTSGLESQLARQEVWVGATHQTQKLSSPIPSNSGTGGFLAHASEWLVRLWIGSALKQMEQSRLEISNWENLTFAASLKAQRRPCHVRVWCPNKVMSRLSKLVIIGGRERRFGGRGGEKKKSDLVCLFFPWLSACAGFPASSPPCLPFIPPLKYPSNNPSRWIMN